jgi:hypothetical protein
MSVIWLVRLSVITIIGRIGAFYRIEYQDSLRDAATWLTLTNFALPNSPFLYIDRDSPNSSKRFYRAVTVP